MPLGRAGRGRRRLRSGKRPRRLHRHHLRLGNSQKGFAQVVFDNLNAAGSVKSVGDGVEHRKDIVLEVLVYLEVFHKKP